MEQSCTNVRRLLSTSGEKEIETAISICKLGGQSQVIQTNIREEWDGYNYIQEANGHHG